MPSAVGRANIRGELYGEPASELDIATSRGRLKLDSQDRYGVRPTEVTILRFYRDYGKDEEAALRFLIDFWSFRA